jgi:hypothetical protein
MFSGKPKATWGGKMFTIPPNRMPLSLVLYGQINREHKHHGATVKAREVVGDEKGEVFVFL